MEQGTPGCLQAVKLMMPLDEPCTIHSLDATRPYSDCHFFQSSTTWVQIDSAVFSRVHFQNEKSFHATKQRKRTENSELFYHSLPYVSAWANRLGDWRYFLKKSCRSTGYALYVLYDFFVARCAQTKRRITHRCNMYPSHLSSRVHTARCPKASFPSVSYQLLYFFCFERRTFIDDRVGSMYCTPTPTPTPRLEGLSSACHMNIFCFLEKKMYRRSSRFDALSCPPTPTPMPLSLCTCIVSIRRK